MKHLLLSLILSLATMTAMAADSGLISRVSAYSVPETLNRLEAVLKAKGVKVFARIDHAAEAEAVGQSLPPTQLLIFGNPKAGTPLMRTNQGIGLDLPMKALAWQNASGQVTLTWNAPEYLIGRHGLDAESGKFLAPISGLIDAALK